VHGERAGFNNTEWDMEFLEVLEHEPEKLTNVTVAQYAERGGLEGAEVVMWLIMRGALNTKVRKLHQSYYLPSMTPIVAVVYENEPEPGTASPGRTYPSSIASACCTNGRA
jgi:gallate dioxygenase